MMQTTGTTRPDRAERRAALLDDPRFERFRTRPRRRRLVLALVGLLVVEAALLLGFVTVATPTGAVVLGASVAALLVGFVFLLGALKASTRGVEELPASVLDERELQVRGEVYRHAYRIGFVLLSPVLLGVGVVAGAGGSVPPEVAMAAALVTFHVAVVLPTLVAAWTAD